MSVLAELSVFPVGAGESVSRYVAEAVEIIRQSGLDYTLGPMGTTMEAEDLASINRVVEACVEAMAAHADRIYLTVKVDWRKGGGGRMAKKVEAVS